MSITIAAHALGENAQLYRLLCAVGLWNAAAGDIVARLDVGGRRLDPGDDQRIVGKLQYDRAAGRLDVQRIALDLIEGAGNALRRRLLRRRGGNRKHRRQGDGRHDPHCAHVCPPNGVTRGRAYTDRPEWRSRRKGGATLRAISGECILPGPPGNGSAALCRSLYCDVLLEVPSEADLAGSISVIALRRVF